METRPLYIDAGGRPTRVRLDGPALLVEREGEAVRRYPLMRLSHVVVHGRAQVDLQVLVACAAGGIAWGCLAEPGEPVGFFLPWRTQREPAARLLAELFCQPGGVELWGNWLRHQEQRAMRETAEALELRLEESRPAHAYAVFATACEAGRSELAALWHWRGLLAGVVGEALVRAGYEPDGLQALRQGVAVTAGLTGVLAWRHWHDLMWDASERGDWAVLVERFERLREREQRRAEALVEEMSAWLGGQRWELVTAGRGW